MENSKQQNKRLLWNICGYERTSFENKGGSRRMRWK